MHGGYGITLKNFRGIAPKVNPAYLRPGAAIEAIDCDFRAGTIRPRKKPRFIKRLNISYGEANRRAGGVVVMPDGRYWGTSSPCHQNGYGGRIFVSGDGSEAPYYLRAADSTLAKFPLGITADGFQLAISASGGSSNDRVDIVYAIAIENQDGDESDLFGSVQAANVRSDATIAVTVSKKAAYNFNFDTRNAKVNLYATSRVASAIGGNYKFIKQWSFTDAGNGATFNDLISTLRNETKIVYSDGTLPSANMKRILSMPGGFLVGHDDNHLYFSEVGKLSIWPVDYRITPPGGGRILGIGVNVEQVYVFIENSSPFVVSALSPTNLQSYFSEVPWPCIAGNSVVNSGGGIVYASRSGFVIIGGQSGNLLTRDFLDERSFMPYFSSNARCIRFNDGVMVIYGGEKTLLLDPQEPEGLGISEISDDIADAKESSGKMIYLSPLAELFEHGGGSESAEARWVSAVLRSPRPRVFNNMYVHGNYSPVSSIFVEGGIGKTAVGKTVLGGSKNGRHTKSGNGETRIKINSVENQITKSITGFIRFRDSDGVPVPSSTPTSDLQVEVQTINEVEEITLTGRGQR